MFKDLFNYFHKNESYTKCQSGFLPGESCISQLLSIVHDINSSFDWNPTQDVRGIFLDISKVFDKVTLEGLKLTLFRMGFFGAAHGWGGAKRPSPLPKICHTYPTMMKFGTVIPYLKRIQKICESRDKPREFC